MFEPTCTETTSAVEPFLSSAHCLGKRALSVWAGAVDGPASRESIRALRETNLLGAYIPQDCGGGGLSVADIAQLCEALSGYCANTALVYAMHSAVVACLVHHGLAIDSIRRYLHKLVHEKRLLASTTWMQNAYSLESRLLIRHSEDADDYLVHGLSSSEGEGFVLVDPIHLEKLLDTSSWIFANQEVGTLIPDSSRRVLARTLRPFSHLTWNWVWVGVAGDAVNRAKIYLRTESRKAPLEVTLGAMRLAEVHGAYQALRGRILQATFHYQHLWKSGQYDTLDGEEFRTTWERQPTIVTRQAVEVISQAMEIRIVSGKENASRTTLNRYLRQAYRAALLVSEESGG